MNACYSSTQIQSSYFIGGHRWTPPIVQVVLQIAIADAKLKRLKKLPVLHEIERIEHVKAHLAHTAHRTYDCCQREDVSIKNLIYNTYLSVVTAVYQANVGQLVPFLPHRQPLWTSGTCFLQTRHS